MNQHLQHVPAKLGELVEEEHATVGETHLTGTRVRTSTDHSGVADGVVRRPKRPPRHE
jgi:hypothetical protein